MAYDTLEVAQYRGEKISCPACGGPIEDGEEYLAVTVNRVRMHYDPMYDRMPDGVTPSGALAGWESEYLGNLTEEGDERTVELHERCLPPTNVDYYDFANWLDARLAEGAPVSA